MNFKKYNLNIILSIIIFTTLLLWLNAPSPQPRFSNFSTILTNLGQISGLIGVVLFSINLMLSTRLRLFDKYFAGINNVYTKHNQLGQIALILLLLHPLLLLSKYATNINEAASFLWFSSNWSINWGILSLGLMVFLITTTLYFMPKYNIWKWIHKFFGLAFFFAFLHLWLIPSDISNTLPLRIFILGFSSIGLIAFLYKSVFGKIFIKKYKYIITNVKKINNSVTEISLNNLGKKLLFKSGQFVFINFINNKIGTEQHPFSISSSPSDNQISFLIKDSGDYTSKIRSVTIGTIAEIEGPFGNFSYQNIQKKSQIWIAGGIGITPFISMARTLSPKQHIQIDLFYCIRNKTEAIHLNLLKKISLSSNGLFKIIPFYSDDKGKISFDIIKRLYGDITEKEILICAPPRMIKNLKQNLILNGIKKQFIRSEEFNF